MRLVEIVRRPSEAERDELVAFVHAVADRDGARPLSDHLWLDLRRGGGPGFLAVRVADADGTRALAQISATNIEQGSSSLELVGGIDARDGLDAVETVIDAYRRGGGGELTWWVDDPTDDALRLAAEQGLAPRRTLFELRRQLPVGERSSVDTRPFVSGVDDEDWLRVNNRAFADHDEQGGWTRDTLALRLAEPWFDADGFRLHERDGRLAAFCWTKLHHDRNPVVGEIYVIGVDPDAQGLGLGRQLTLAGLDAIADRGVGTAMLYVDGHNDAALGLYRALGFTTHRTRRAFVGRLAPRPA